MSFPNNVYQLAETNIANYERNQIIINANNSDAYRSLNCSFIPDKIRVQAFLDRAVTDNSFKLVSNFMQAHTRDNTLTYLTSSRGPASNVFVTEIYNTSRTQVNGSYIFRARKIGSDENINIVAGGGNAQIIIVFDFYRFRDR